MPINQSSCLQFGACFFRLVLLCSPLGLFRFVASLDVDSLREAALQGLTNTPRAIFLNVFAVFFGFELAFNDSPVRILFKGNAWIDTSGEAPIVSVIDFARFGVDILEYDVVRIIRGSLYRELIVILRKQSVIWKAYFNTSPSHIICCHGICDRASIERQETKQTA